MQNLLLFYTLIFELHFSIIANSNGTVFNQKSRYNNTSISFAATFAYSSMGVLADIRIEAAFFAIALISALGLGLLIHWYHMNRKQVIT